MSVNVEISQNDLAEIQEITGIDDDAECIIAAIKEFIRIRRLRELKFASGRVEYEERLNELDQLDLLAQQRIRKLFDVEGS